MKKLPSYLKGLVESRARSAGDIERLEQLRARLDEEIAAARRRLEWADTLIRKFNPIVDPTLIEPVHGRRPPVVGWLSLRTMRLRRVPDHLDEGKVAQREKG